MKPKYETKIFWYMRRRREREKETKFFLAYFGWDILVGKIYKKRERIWGEREGLKWVNEIPM